MERVKGFTLIELMVTIAVLAIVIGIAVPSFAAMIRDNRAESQSGSMATALNLARSEAVKRGQNVTVRPVSGTNWTGGWEVAVGTEILRRFPGLEGASFSTGATDFTFNSRGRLKDLAMGATTTIGYRVGADSCRYERDISVNAVGRVSIARRSCS